MIEEKENKYGFTTLERIVYGFLDNNDRGEESYRKAYNLGIKGYRDIMLDVLGTTSTAFITVLANKTGRLPEDFGNYIRIGVPNSDTAELATFVNNENLTTANVESVDRLSYPNTDTYQGGGSLNSNTIPRDVYFPFYNYRSLGVGSVNDIGQFKIDKINGYVVFDPNITYGKVVLEYAQDINCVADNYMVDNNGAQAVEDYITWKWNWNRKDIPVSEKILQRKEYYNQKRIARNRINPIRLQDINDISRKWMMGAAH